MERELKEILDPTGTLPAIEMKVKRGLFNKYPRKLTRRELKIIEERKEQQEIEEAFQRMYGLKEDDSD